MLLHFLFLEFVFVLFLCLSGEPDMLMDLRDRRRNALAASQLPAQGTESKIYLAYLSNYIFTTPFPAVQVLPGKNKRVDLRLQSVCKHG